MRSVLTTAAVLGALSSVSFAGFTNVGKVPAAEHSQERMLEQFYGGDFTRIGADFFNGSISVRRVDDGMTVNPAMSLARGTIGDTTDESFDGANLTIRPMARFSGNSQSLSISDGSTTHKLFDVTGYGYDINSTQWSGELFGKTIEFIREGDSGVQSSITGKNSDGRDHMITYEVLGLKGKGKTWLMLFEDLNLTPGLAKGRTSSDFNDLAFEVRATAVPLPAAVWAGGAIIGAVTLMRKRIRKIAGI